MIGSDMSIPLTMAEATLVFSYTPDGMEYRLARAAHLADPHDSSKEGCLLKLATNHMNTTNSEE